MVLLAVPCGDVYNNCSESKLSLQESSHSHNQDEEDHCTPFCQCACCSVSVVKFNFKLPEFNVPQPAIHVKNTVIRDCQIISSYSGNIWEPPRFFV